MLRARALRDAEIIVIDSPWSSSDFGGPADPIAEPNGVVMRVEVVAPESKIDAASWSDTGGDTDRAEEDEREESEDDRETTADGGGSSSEELRDNGPGVIARCRSRSKEESLESVGGAIEDLRLGRP